MEIVFVGQCEVFVCLGFVAFFFFPLAAKLIGLQTGCQFFKNIDFFWHHRLNAMAYLRDWWSFLEIVFVGQCVRCLFVLDL